MGVNLIEMCPIFSKNNQYFTYELNFLVAFMDKLCGTAFLLLTKNHFLKKLLVMTFLV